ncbi:MAG: hypothetical protein WCH03_04520 [Flavobacteriia bacterium]|jgi:hypothetical protein
MKKATLLAALILSTAAFSQNLKISEIHISSGSGSMETQDGTLSDFAKLAPNSAILAMDLSQLTPYNNSYFNGFRMNAGSNSTSLQLGLQCAKMPKITFRVGLTHVSNFGMLSAHGSFYESAPYDTLTSSQTGQQTFIDSSHSKSYEMNYSNQQIRLDGALIFRMFPEKRWSLHTGLGASIGMSYRANTHINYWENSSVSYNYQGSGNYGSGTGTNESFKNKNSLGASLYIPFGVDFCIGKKREFWMPFHLYVESRPSLNINSISGIGTSFSPGMSSAAGLRVKL